MINIIVLCSCFIAAIADCKTETIPKWCTYPLIITGFVYQIAERKAVLAIVILLIWFLLTYIPGIGNGDYKFLLGETLLLGPLFTLKMFLTANCIAGIAYILTHPHAILLIKNKKIGYLLNENADIPMGLAFAVSTVIGLYAGFLL